MTDHKIFPLLTSVNIETKFRFSYRKHFLFIGSCFSEHMSVRMKDAGFTICSNPYGISYNPVSIASQLEDILQLKSYDTANFELRDELFTSWAHHGKFKNTDAARMADSINSQIQAAYHSLSNNCVLVLSLGTAFVHRLVSNGQIVNNCHKYPADFFYGSLLKIPEIVDHFELVITKLLEKWPDIQLIFTVSPVRHLSEGLQMNQLSKASLLLATNEICSRFSENVSYFPAYELMIDELRDYRFYDDSLTHPNTTAINYIWNKWLSYLMADETKSIINEVEKYNNLKQHKILFPDTQSAIKHIAKIQLTYQQLSEKYPEIKLQDPG